MPGFQQVMDSLPLNQRAGKDRAEIRRTFAGPKALHVDAARQVIELAFRETLDAESVSRALGENDEQIGQVVFLDETLALEDEPFFPAALWRRGLRRPRSFAAVTMPGRDFD